MLLWTTYGDRNCDESTITPYVTNGAAIWDSQADNSPRTWLSGIASCGIKLIGIAPMPLEDCTTLVF